MKTNAKFGFFVLFMLIQIFFANTSTKADVFNNFEDFEYAISAGLFTGTHYGKAHQFGVILELFTFCQTNPSSKGICGLMLENEKFEEGNKYNIGFALYAFSGPPLSLRAAYSQIETNEASNFFHPNRTYRGVEIAGGIFFLDLKLGLYNSPNDGNYEEQTIISVSLGYNIYISSNMW